MFRAENCPFVEHKNLNKQYNANTIGGEGMAKKKVKVPIRGTWDWS